MPWYSSVSWTAMPIGAPPRQIATRNVGLKPLRTIRMASSIESRSSESAEMKTFSMAGEGLGSVTNAFGLENGWRSLTHPAHRRVTMRACQELSARVQKRRDQGPHYERRGALAKGKSRCRPGAFRHTAGRH